MKYLKYLVTFSILCGFASQVESVIRRCFPVTTTQAPIDSTTQSPQIETTTQTDTTLNIGVNSYNLTLLLDEFFELQAQIDTLLVYLDGNSTAEAQTIAELVSLISKVLEDKTIPSDNATFLQEFADFLQNNSTTTTKTLVRRKRRALT
jgi:biopolymer transport protein ExbD